MQASDDLMAFGTIALLIVIAPYLSRLSRLPVAVIEIILGALACYYGLFRTSEVIETVAHISFLYLMLLAGMEADIRGFGRLGRGFYKRASAYFLVLYSLTAAIVAALQLKWIYIAILPVMSLGMVVPLLREYGKEQIWLNITVKIGVIGELLSIVALVIVQNSYAQEGLESTWHFYKSLIFLALFVLACVFIFRLGRVIFWWKPSIKLWFMPTNDSYNQDLRFSFMLFFVLIGITTLIDIEDVLGAFMAGLVVATFFVYKHDMIHKLNDVGFGFFVPLFFIHVGSTLNLGVILSDYRVMLNGTLLAAGMLAVRMISSYIAFGAYFKNLKHTTLFSLSGCMPLTLLVAIAKIGLGFGALGNLEYYSLIIAAIFEGIFFTILIKIIYFSRGSGDSAYD